MTLLIENVQVLGAREKFSGPVDVFISGEKISAIGDLGGKVADQMIEGQGAYLAPGFIDVNTDSDHYLSLFTDPEQSDFLRQGVTTIIGGNCGASLAPLLYGGLESIQKWADLRQINVDWHTVHEFLSLFETKRPLGVNFATLIGHATIRRALLGESLRDLTKNELMVFSETLRKALQEGGFGLSTGLGYVHSRKVPYQEVKSLLGIIKEHDGVYTTHLRKSGSELQESIDETVRVAKETGVKTIVSHLLPLRGFEREYEKALETIDGLPPELDVHFDLYPFDMSMLALYTFLPLWAQNGGLEVMASNVKDEWLHARIVKDLPEISDHHGFIVAQAPRNNDLVGRSLKDLTEIYEKGPREALLHLMIATNLRATVLYRNINGGFISRALKSPRAFVSSNAASMREDALVRIKKPERATATFPRFLAMAEKENLMSLEDAISKITREPARLFGIKGRGVIQEGAIADLAGFKNGEVKFTVVNGRVAMKDGVRIGVLAGRVFRHHAQ